MQNSKLKIKNYGLFFISILYFSFFIFNCLSGADIFLQLKSGGRKTNIFIYPTDNSRHSADIRKIVSEDLIYSGIFNLISLPSGQLFATKFDFQKSDRDIAVANGIDTVVKFESKTSKNKITLSGNLWDAASAKKIFDKEYKYPEHEIRKLAHNFSEDIIKSLTGQKISFSSKIAFSNTMSGNKEIWCVDYDGKNLMRLTYNNSISVLPKFSSDGKYIYYTTYKDGNPDIFRYDFEKNRSVSFITYQGLNITGSASPDGEYLIATLSKDGDSELYLFTTDGKIARRLTYSRGVDTAASFSPNSHEFVFVSDRGGNPQLYIMDIEGSNLRKITHSGYNDSPCWSPVGGAIAFTKRTGSRFDIYVMDVSTNKEYQLTKNSGSNENPSFSSDGRRIIFSSNRTGRYELFSMYADGTEQKPISSIAKESTNPVWSP
ncbi:MAG TPA: Tol-Pal system beta propeller repeat protein TolB [Elusimicrobia bacterium]|nr:Tol-Pal system beta propeller repeat protein TolB [Elusimicrobiota bacterium]